MAAQPVRARPDYDYLIKLLLIGDSGGGKSCLLLRFSGGSFTPSFIPTIGIDFMTRTIELDEKRIKLLLWDTAGEERFRRITTAYYTGAMGILLVYDVTDESSFNSIRNWIRSIEQHDCDNVNKILVGNKADMDDKRAVPTAKGQALADKYGIKFFETSVKTNLNVEQVFFSIAKDIKQRLPDTDTKAEGAHNIYTPPPSLISVIGPAQGSSYIHDWNLSHEVGGVSGQALSIDDMARDNMSSGSTHSYSRDESAPSWNDLNNRESTTMTESDNLSQYSWEMRIESDNFDF